jgi:hypothetical protein
MRASVTSSQSLLPGATFFIFETLYVVSLVLMLVGSDHVQLLNWNVPVLGLLWISFVGLLVMASSLRKRKFPFASIGWPTLLIGFLLGLLTPTL